MVLSKCLWCADFFVGQPKFIWFGTKLNRQVVEIPMGTNWAPLVADLLYPRHENGWGIKCYPCPSVLFIRTYVRLSRRRSLSKSNTFDPNFMKLGHLVKDHSVFFKFGNSLFRTRLSVVMALCLWKFSICMNLAIEGTSLSFGHISSYCFVMRGTLWCLFLMINRLVLLMLLTLHPDILDDI